jgi:hypothetical protein
MSEIIETVYGVREGRERSAVSVNRPFDGCGIQETQRPGGTYAVSKTYHLHL